MIIFDNFRLIRVVPHEDPPTRSKIGPAAADVMISELGRGETKGQNDGPDIDRYRGGVGHAGDPWCAALVFYDILTGCETRLGIPCPIKRSHRALELFARCGRAGCFVNRPMRGDVVAWTRAGGGHIGLVTRIIDEGAFESGEGNVGAFPSKARLYTHELGEPRLAGFARLP